MPTNNTVLIIDGLNFLWKAYSAPFEFSSEKGVRLDVITVFLSLLRACIEKSEANYAVVVFDHPQADNFRLEDDDYKTNRVQDFSEADDSPFHHLDNLKKVLDYLFIGWIESDLAEADDVIFTLAKSFVGRVYIASSDTDFYQCVDDRVKILKVRGSKNIEVLDEEWVYKRLGAKPNQYVLYKSLTGDKADNIAGVKGVGPKTAARIINDPDLAKNYEENKDLILKNIKLIELIEVDGIGIDWDKLKLSGRMVELKNADIFKKLGF